MDPRRAIDRILHLIRQEGMTPTDFLVILLGENHPGHQDSVVDLITRRHEIIDALASYDSTAFVDECICDPANRIYADEIKNISAKEGGFHFNVIHTSAHQLEEFDTEDMAKKMQSHAPRVWKLLDALLQRSWDTMDTRPVAERVPEETTDDEDDCEDINQADPASDHSAAAQRNETKILIKKVVIMSIAMQSKNQLANAFQSFFAMYLQSSHAPRKIVETLARMGMSVSTFGINLATRALSASSQLALRSLGQTLLAGYAYDNFDVDLKSSDPKKEDSMHTLKHLTSGLLFPLQHGVRKEDLRCSDLLWERSVLNPNARNLPVYGWRDLLSLHPEVMDDAGLSRQDRFIAWKMLSDLIKHGPEYFAGFRDRLQEPETVESVPVIKTPVLAARAMDFSNPTVTGNIQSIVEILRQGGIGDPVSVDGAGLQDISEYVIPIWGDLGTGERIQSAQLRRSIEETAWGRLQYAVFAPGLFHAKMAAVDWIWRVFLQPHAARLDETSLMRHVGVLRPHETGCYGTKPGFRRMHQLITYDGICRRLDCWRVELENHGFASLEAFATSQPSFEFCQSMANSLANKFVTNHGLRDACRNAGAMRDEQNKNGILLNKCMLLYEEFSYAMNVGDIGRVETCLIAWILIFKATGKHKYATHITEFLCKLHFVYPDGLRHALRYHMLINPTGKKGKFRAVDWCVELNNLFTKVINGGLGSNRTVARILLESPLVQVYQNLHRVFEKSFLHTNLTSQHAEADMTKTFRELQKYMRSTSAHAFCEGRKSNHIVPDPFERGEELVYKAEWDGSVDEGEGLEEQPTMEDVMVDLGL